MKLATFIFAALTNLCCLCAAAQIYVFENNYSTIPQEISVGTLDEEIAKGKVEAAKANDPIVEFNVVKLQVKNIVDHARITQGQSVTFANADQFRKWMRYIAQKTGKPYEMLRDELLAAVAPNPCPALTGDDPNYIKGLARQHTATHDARTEASEVSDTLSTDTHSVQPDPSMHSAAEYRGSGPSGNPALIKVDFVDTVTTASRTAR